MRKIILITAAVLIAGGAGLAYSRHAGEPASKPAKKPPLVSVAVARRQDLPLELSAQGHLVALNLVEVRPQLTAIITAIHFKEGDEVKAGQLLFSLDSADASAQLRRYEAQAAQIQAQLADANRDYNRSAELVKSHFITSSAVDTSASKVDALKAQLKAARADIDGARLVLAHTSIVAPITARTGAVAVHPGSLAQTSAAAPLVTLAQFAPIGVEFNLPEQYLAAILRARAQGPVTVLIDGADGDQAAGQLSFINNTVNTDSGTISLKAAMPNRRGALWPGAYARVTIQAGIEKNAIMLPPQALLEGPDGRFVFLAGADGKVAQQNVTLLRIQNGQAVVAGLGGGARVVLEGGGGLRTGDTVRIADDLAPARASPAGAKAAP